MPLPFSSIPEHIQISIVQKLNIEDFIRFQQCSRECYEITDKVRTKFVIHLKELTFHHRGQDLPFTGDRIPYFTNPTRLENLPIHLDVEWTNINVMLRSVKENISGLSFTSHGLNFRYNAYFCNWSPQDFNFLLEFMNVKKLQFIRPISGEILRIPAMKQITFLSMMDSRLKDDDFLSLNIPEMYLSETNITAKAINKFIKGWLSGKRNILDVEISFNDQDIRKKILFAGLSLNSDGELTSRDGKRRLSITFGSTVYISDVTPNY